LLTVGLTGNIGAGKSTVARLLVAHGAHLVDADQVAREVVEPGAPAYQPLVDRFGTAVLDVDGRIDRPKLAEVAFADPATLADLNAIVHPAIGVAMIEGKDAWKDTDDVVVMDIPLLKEFHKEMLALDAVVVVDVSPEVRMERLVGQRGMAEDDVRARMAAQPTREERLAGADYVIDNSGDAAHLAAEVDRVWAELVAPPQRSGASAATTPPAD
jgi:dephospho-CoA kinase